MPIVASQIVNQLMKPLGKGLRAFGRAISSRPGLKKLGRSETVLRYYARAIWRTRAFWMRALLCWFIAAILLNNDETTNYDLRLKIRGPRPAVGPAETTLQTTGGPLTLRRFPGRIILIDVSERDWSELDPATRNVLRPLKEVVSFTDAFFWNQRAWHSILTHVLDDNPKSVGVTFFFGENVRSPHITASTSAVFYDKRIVWGADVDSSGRLLIPLFATTYNNNVGLRSLRPDEDGTIRRANFAGGRVPDLAAKVAETSRPDLAEKINSVYRGGALVNFSGSVLDGAFPVINARDLIEGRIPPGTFKDKVVLIGSLGNTTEQFQTPLGRMSRTEIIANAIDDVLADQTVTRFDRGYYLALLAALLAGAIWILSAYPQSVAVIGFALAAIIWSALSAAAFDILHVWIPLLSPLVELVAVCIVFLSYQLALNERRTWKLEQESRYASEIEQLKTNFVSMMSHDLKTPIAKIQAICDRLLSGAVEAETMSAGSLTTPKEIVADLKTLRRSSDELHRYIQSILQVTKVEAKDFQITKEVTDINENIERVLLRLQPLANEKRVSLTLNLEPMFSIEADQTLLQEVIHNLVENAIKYTPAGGSISVTSQEKDDNVIVVVEDTGPGIDPSEQSDVWGKFTRGRNQSLDIKGSGLGLYLVKYFIELHGGQVFLESRSATVPGARIGFSIPVSSEKGSSDDQL